jgi:hypothetical protein
MIECVSLLLMTSEDFLLLPSFSLSRSLSSEADDEVQEEETPTCSTHFIIVNLGSRQTLDGSIAIVRRWQ